MQESRTSEIRLDHVTLSFEHGIQALDDLSLDVPKGQHLCILGANGSGKSTLAAVISGLMAPDAGTVEIAGEQVYRDGKADFEAYRQARRKCGLVFQNPGDQIVTTVVEDDIAFGPENLGLPPEEIDRRVKWALHKVALEAYAKRDPTRMSGGQQQRVAIAATLAMEPELYVFDEPGALLDVRGRRSIMKAIQKLSDAGRTIIHITHFMEEALAADRTIVLSKGKIVLDGTPQEVFSHTDEIAALGLEEPFAGRLSRRLLEGGADIAWTASTETLLDELAVRIPATEASICRITQAKPASAQSADAPVLSVSHVTYSYADSSAHAAPALQDVSLSVEPGESAAIVGQTGSGKSTLARLICALDVPDAGAVSVLGVSTQKKRDRRLLHGKIGYVMQHPERQLFAQTVAEDVAYGPKNLGLSADEVSRRVAHALALVGLEGRENVSPFELSGGQKRKCALAGVIAMEPHILVLDEPTAGLDPLGRRELRSILDAVHQEGVATVEITHSMDDAARADHVFVLDESKLLLSGTPAEIFCGRNAELLHERGLGLPAALTFALALEERLGGDGCPASSAGDPLTIDALAEALLSMLSEGRR
ncbi:MAG: ABC transporter ATP-binding protein [Atopobiaceae bacterium]